MFACCVNVMSTCPDPLTLLLQHNMATSVDKAAILEAYNEVMADSNAGVEWWVFFFIFQDVLTHLAGPSLPSTRTTRWWSRPRGRSLMTSRRTLLPTSVVLATLKYR